MKNFITISFISLLATSSSWANLPLECENLAWRFAKVQTEVEDYAEITGIQHDKITGVYSALISPMETCIYEMKFQYNKNTNKCLILSINADYR